MSIPAIVSNMPPEAATVITAALPVSELRGAIPLAVLQFGFVWWKAFLLSVFGNMLPVVPWLFFLNYAQKRLMRFRPAGIFFRWLFNRTRKKGGLVEKYETIGLMLFVAVPLPITGAWTGAVAAFLFGIKLRYALTAIFYGVLIAGTIVTSLTMMGRTGAFIAGIALILIAASSLLKRSR